MKRCAWLILLSASSASASIFAGSTVEICVTDVRTDSVVQLQRLVVDSDGEAIAALFDGTYFEVDFGSAQAGVLTIDDDDYSVIWDARGLIAEVLYGDFYTISVGGLGSAASESEVKGWRSIRPGVWFLCGLLTWWLFASSWRRNSWGTL